MKRMRFVERRIYGRWTKRKTADETENPLQTMTEQWMQLERKTTKQREAADLFYEKKLMNLIEDNFIARNRERV